MGRTACHAFVSGRVQGVAFRWSTRERAQALGVGGWVRNLHDGRVEVWIEGEAGSVEALVAWLRDGPPSARVTGVDVRPVAPDVTDGRGEGALPAFEVRPSRL